MKIETIIKEKKGTIVDVRTTSEFMGGNVAGSINIPLQEIQHRMDELKYLKQRKLSLRFSYPLMNSIYESTWLLGNLK